MKVGQIIYVYTVLNPDYTRWKIGDQVYDMNNDNEFSCWGPDVVLYPGSDSKYLRCVERIGNNPVQKEIKRIGTLVIKSLK